MRTATIRVEVQGTDEELDRLCQAIYRQLKHELGGCDPHGHGRFGNITFDKPETRTTWGWTLYNRYTGPEAPVPPGFDPARPHGSDDPAYE